MSMYVYVCDGCGAQMTHAQKCAPDCTNTTTAGCIEVAPVNEPDTDLARFLGSVHFILPNFNDTFGYACADTEQISVGDGEFLAEFWRRHGWHGLVAIAAWKRDRTPIPPVARHEKFKAAMAELEANAQIPDPHDDTPWTVLDEFELSPRVVPSNQTVERDDA